MDKSEAALRREGAKLEEDFTRLSTAKTAAEKKENFWSQETIRLGRKVVRTRTTVEAQLKLVLGKRQEVERAQRVLKQAERDLGRQRSVLSQEESELKDSETAQRIARENCKVKLAIWIILKLIKLLKVAAHPSPGWGPIYGVQEECGGWLYMY